MIYFGLEEAITGIQASEQSAVPPVTTQEIAE
jgi:hypothetical protein